MEVLPLEAGVEAAVVVAAGVAAAVVVAAGWEEGSGSPPLFFSLILSLMAPTQPFVVCSLSE